MFEDDARRLPEIPQPRHGSFGQAAVPYLAQREMAHEMNRIFGGEAAG
jgi:hypothetical protein